jgi:polar amino acid transport system ATP-binding protein
MLKPNLSTRDPEYLGGVNTKLIAVDRVRKSYNDAPALRDISFSVESSQLTVIIGPSGCGKSTLLRCLNGLEVIDAGVIRVGEITLEGGHNNSSGFGAKLQSLRQETGMVFQSFNLFPHLNVLENVIKAPMVVKGVARPEAEARARDLLGKVGLSDRIDAYPSQLSGGQQQRAAIARALAMSPRVLLYDEPTSALDPTLVDEVLNIMRQLDDEGMTQIVVTHEMRFARNVADQVLVLAEGELIESGPPQLIFSSPADQRTRDFLRNFL